MTTPTGYVFEVSEPDQGTQRIGIRNLATGNVAGEVAFKGPLPDADYVQTAIIALLDDFERRNFPGKLTTQETGIRDGRMAFIAGVTLGNIEVAIKKATPDMEKLMKATRGSDLGPTT
ncbi:MAG TPA: hypothetical protein VNU68_35130 [Verrucomicrobiae bacterium]|nr:hypothetical protein [Verrucomicrobiae bacterium]